MKFYFHFHKLVFYFLKKMHYNGLTNIYVIYKVQLNFALEVWFSIYWKSRLIRTALSHVHKRKMVRNEIS